MGRTWILPAFLVLFCMLLKHSSLITTIFFSFLFSFSLFCLQLSRFHTSVTVFPCSFLFVCVGVLWRGSVTVLLFLYSLCLLFVSDGLRRLTFAQRNAFCAAQVRDVYSYDFFPSIFLQPCFLSFGWRSFTLLPLADCICLSLCCAPSTPGLIRRFRPYWQHSLLIDFRYYGFSQIQE